MYCKECGKVLLSEARFCSYCGTAVEPLPGPEPAPAAPEPIPPLQPVPVETPAESKPAAPASPPRTQETVWRDASTTVGAILGGAPRPAPSDDPAVEERFMPPRPHVGEDAWADVAATVNAVMEDSGRLPVQIPPSPYAPPPPAEAQEPVHEPASPPVVEERSILSPPPPREHEEIWADVAATVGAVMEDSGRLPVQTPPSPYAPPPVMEERQTLPPIPPPVEEERQTLPPIPPPVMEERQTLPPIPPPVMEERQTLPPIPPPREKDGVWTDVAATVGAVMEDSRRQPAHAEPPQGVAPPYAHPVRVPPPPVVEDRFEGGAHTPRKKHAGLLTTLVVLSVLAVTTVVMLAGAYFDLFDPLGIREVLWLSEEAPTPPTPDASGASPAATQSGEDQTPPVAPVSRGTPVGDGQENTAQLLLACDRTATGSIGGQDKLPGGQLVVFAQAALQNAHPEERSFEPSANGFLVEQADLDTLLTEGLGHTVDDWNALNDDDFSGGLSRADKGFVWQPDNAPERTVDFSSWEEQPDGTVRASFVVMTKGMLYNSFRQKGTAVLQKNENPTYFQYRLQSLAWAEDGRVPVTVKASSTLPDQNGNSYAAKNLTDDDPATAWIEGQKGDGLGEWLELTFDGPTEISGITLVNGYEKDDKTLKRNNRVKEIRVECGSEILEFTLEDVDYHEGGDYQSFFFGKSMTASKIIVTIVSVYPGSTFKDTCLSEISVF